jgi:putative transposase
MEATAEKLVELAREFCDELYSWCLLPNHYHLSVETSDIRGFQSELGKFHGRTSFEWNKEDDQRGRKVWFRSFERPIDSTRHFYVTLNYIHNNPVKHGYVRNWLDWPYSSAFDYLETVGREEAKRIWLEYPVLGYGDSWDR